MSIYYSFIEKRGICVVFFLNYIRNLQINYIWKSKETFPYKHTTWIPRWNNVEMAVSTFFQRGIHVGSKHRAHKRTVLRLSYLIFSPSELLYNPWSCSEVTKAFLFLMGEGRKRVGVYHKKFFVRSSDNGNLDLFKFVSYLFELVISPFLDEI